METGSNEPNPPISQSPNQRPQVPKYQSTWEAEPEISPPLLNFPAKAGLLFPFARDITDHDDLPINNVDKPAQLTMAASTYALPDALP